LNDVVDETQAFLEDIRGYVAEDAPRNTIGTIDTGYTTGRPRVLFDGETVLGGKTYPYLASYTPAASHRVLLAPAGSSYVILGRIV
jgi:hypothetical protein